MKHLILTLLCLLCLAVPSLAQQTTISYQGLLASETGVPANGTYSITISFYSDESGTHALWQDTFETLVKNGQFNIDLGARLPLPNAAVFANPIWVGTRIGDNAELRPRTKLGSVPNAISAQTLGTDYLASLSL